MSKPLRTPLLLQMEAAECGAAALGIVLAHHGLHVPLPVLRRECGVSRDGSRASNLVKAARAYGMEAKGYRKELDTVREVTLPAILFWGFNHFVVLEGFRGGNAYINDPAIGRRIVDKEEFDAQFTGVVLVMQPGPGFQKGGERPGVSQAVRRILQGSFLPLLFCFLAGLFLVAPSLVLPALVQVFIDYVLIQGLSDWLAPVLLALLATSLIQGLLQLLQLRHLRELRVKLAIGLSGRFVAHVLRLPIVYFSQRYSGEVSSRIDLNDNVADLLSGDLASTVIDCVMLVFLGALMAFYDPVLTAVGIGSVLLNVFGLHVVSSLRDEANRRVLQEEGKLGGVAIAGLQGMETIKASTREATFFARWAGTYAKAISARQSLALADQGLGALPGLLRGLTALTVLVVGGLRVMDGDLTIGMLIAFQLLLASFQRPVDGLVGMAARMQVLGGDLARLDDVLDHPLDPRADDHAPDPEAGRLAGKVELRSVSFGYNPLAPPLLDDVSLTIEPGQRVAVVGPSGSGKSTLARLAAGLYAPWRGEVLLDGRRLGEHSRRVLANSLSLVEQDIFFFAGTVRENLTLWDRSIPDADLEHAARDAEVHDVIRALPGGYSAPLQEGARNLSGGQRQRLEIARALVRQPSILVLDEASSALDGVVEEAIDRNLRRRGCACLVVSHRLSTIRDCDEILVLEGGRVVERGTFDALRGAGGAFDALLGEEIAGG